MIFFYLLSELPELLYGEDESYSVLFRKKIPLTYSLNANNEVTILILLKLLALKNEGVVYMYFKWLFFFK